MNNPDFNGFASRVKSRLDEVFSDEFTFQNEKPEDELGLEMWHTARKLLPGESPPEATDVARIAGRGDQRLLKRDLEHMRSILREELTRFMDNLLDPAPGKDRRIANLDRRRCHTYLARDRRSGIADRRKRAGQVSTPTPI